MVAHGPNTSNVRIAEIRNRFTVICTPAGVVAGETVIKGAKVVAGAVVPVR